ncbi:MAG: hypothetical protein AAFQ68_00825 [Bacteroidota bacterium]
MKRRRWNLSGSSMLYSLMISLLVSALLGAYLLADASLRQLSTRVYGQGRAEDNLRSAVETALNAAEVQDDWSDFEWMAEEDTMSAYWERWGAFGLLHAEGRHFRFRDRKSFLIGRELRDQKTALVLSDEGLPLVLTGQSRIKGSIHIPEGTLRLEGWQGQKEEIVIRRSKRLRATDYPSIPEWIKSVLGQNIQRVSSAVVWAPSENVRTDNWREEAIEIGKEGRIILNGGTYSGKILIHANDKIEVRPNTQLEDVILIAPKILIRAGTKGRFQAFAGDSLWLEEGVKLEFPSLVAVCDQQEGQAYLHIDTSCRIEGAVLYYNPYLSNAPSTIRPQVMIREESSIYGTVHVAGNLSLKGVVNGQVITQGFVLRTEVGTVRNHLRDAQLNRDRLAPAYAGPFLEKTGPLRPLRIFDHETKVLAKWE